MRKFLKNKISIIIPTYNEANNIISLIREIIKEIDNKDYEIIIVDDGSSDDSIVDFVSVTPAILGSAWIDPSSEHTLIFLRPSYID